jgi:tetratricopeptide (TPR) repeat protein
MKNAVKYLLALGLFLGTTNSAFCDKADDCVAKGRAKEVKLDWNGAIEEYTRAIQLRPNYPEAYYYRGGARKAKLDWNGAIADYTQAIQFRPDYPEAYYYRALAKSVEGTYDPVTKLRSGDIGGAIADYTAAIQLKPSYVDAYINRGAMKSRIRGDLDGGIADFTKAIELSPDAARAYINRGDARQEKGYLDAAIADYTKAIQLKPDNLYVYTYRGNAKKLKGDLAGATADFTIAGVKQELSSNPSVPQEHNAPVAQSEATAERSATDLVMSYLTAAATLGASATRDFLAAGCKDDIETEFLAYERSGWTFSGIDTKPERVLVAEIRGEIRGANVSVQIVFRGGSGTSMRSGTFMTVSTTFFLVMENGAWKVSGMNPPPDNAGPGVTPL